MSNGKYFVVKKDDIKTLRHKFRMNANFAEMLDILEQVELPDAEVIRHQDITSAAIFYHYSQSMHSFVDVAEALGAPLDSQRRYRLLEIADYFGDAAAKAQASESRRLPD